MAWSDVSLYGFQNGGAPLLYAVHGNHVRCVEILLGENPSLQTKTSPAFMWRAVITKIWCLFSRERS